MVVTKELSDGTLNTCTVGLCTGAHSLDPMLGHPGMDYPRIDLVAATCRLAVENSILNCRDDCTVLLTLLQPRVPLQDCFRVSSSEVPANFRCIHLWLSLRRPRVLIWLSAPLANLAASPTS